MFFLLVELLFFQVQKSWSKILSTTLSTVWPNSLPKNMSNIWPINMVPNMTNRSGRSISEVSFNLLRPPVARQHVFFSQHLRRNKSISILLSCNARMSMSFFFDVHLIDFRAPLDTTPEFRHAVRAELFFKASLTFLNL